MKFAIKSLLVALSFVAISATAYAGIPTEKIVKEARAEVEAASPDDWYTYAEAASKCIERGINMREASAWIKKSVDIKETVYNMKVLGDYYVANRLPEKAVEAYSKSIRIGKLKDDNYADKATQDKVVALVKEIGY
jgi:hypothetical protein